MMDIKLDEGYTFGKGAFETIAVMDKKPLFLDMHLKRLASTLKFFDIKNKVDLDKIYEYINNHSKKNFALKIIVSDENFIITSRENNYIDNYESFTLKKSEVIKNSSSKLIYHKSLCYYENILEHKIANIEGYKSALFVNERGEITETSTANIFFVKAGVIYTPKLSCGLLKGTMREYLIQNYKIYEDIILYNDLEKYDEIFISNSLMGIRNVSKIDKLHFKNMDITNNILKYLKKYGF